MMDRLELRVPALDEERDVVDLAAVLIGLSGVARVTADRERHLLTVEFDPDYVDPPSIAHVVEQSGYPLDSEPIT